MSSIQSKYRDTLEYTLGKRDVATPQVAVINEAIPTCWPAEINAPPESPWKRIYLLFNGVCSDRLIYIARSARIGSETDVMFRIECGEQIAHRIGVYVDGEFL